MLEQIMNNDENTNDDARKSQVSMADGSEARHDDQRYGYFVENGSTYNGWVINTFVIFKLNWFKLNRHFDCTLFTRTSRRSQAQLTYRRIPPINPSKFATNPFEQIIYHSTISKQTLKSINFFLNQSVDFYFLSLRAREIRGEIVELFAR